MRMRPAAIVGIGAALLAMAGCDTCAKKKGPDLGLAAPAAGSVTCFDLAGASRRAMVATDDGRKVLFLERASKDADTRLLSVDLATEKATVVVESVGEDLPIVLGGKVLYVALGAKNDAGVHEHGRLVARDLASGAETVLADGALAPRSFVVDRKTEAVFFVGTEAGVKDGVAFQTTLAGGPPKKIGAAILIWAVAADGKSLIIRGRDKDAPAAFGTETDTLALDGTVTKLGPNGYSVTPLGDVLVYASVDDKSPLQVRSATGSIAPLGGSLPKDLLFLGSPIVAREVKDSTTLYRVKPAGLEALLTLGGVGVEAAVSLPNGGVVVLATQDTHGDGAFGAGDEHDVCLVGPQSGPIAVPKRDTPKRYATLLPALRQAASQDLPGATVKLSEDGVHAVLPGEGDPDWEALREKARVFYKHAIEAAKDPKLAVGLTYVASPRAATCYAPDGAAHETCRVGVAGVAWLEDRTAHDLALDSKGFRDVGLSGTKYRCGGVVTNLSDKTLRASVVCNLVSGSGADEKVIASKHLDVDALAPKATAKFDLDLGASDVALLDVKALTLVDGQGVVPFFTGGEAKAAAWLATTDAIRKNTGFAVRPNEHATSLDTSADFDVPKGFGAMTDAARKELVTKFRAELLAFNKKADPTAGDYTGMLALYDEGKLAWFLHGDGTLTPTTTAP